MCDCIDTFCFALHMWNNQHSQRNLSFISLDVFSSVFRRNCDSDCSDGEEDFYYTEIKLNTDSVADGLSGLSPVSPSVLSPPPPPPSPLPSLNQLADSHRAPQASDTKEPHAGGTTPLSRSAPSALYLIHTDHAYQVNTHTQARIRSMYAVILEMKIKDRCTLWINIHTTTHLSGDTHTHKIHIFSLTHCYQGPHYPDYMSQCLQKN